MTHAKGRLARALVGLTRTLEKLTHASLSLYRAKATLAQATVELARTLVRRAGAKLGLARVGVEVTCPEGLIRTRHVHTARFQLTLRLDRAGVNRLPMLVRRAFGNDGNGVGVRCAQQ